MNKLQSKLFKHKRRVTSLLVAVLVLASLIVLWRLPLTQYGMGVLSSKISHRPAVAGMHVVKLNVPYHRQEHSLSCEAAALKMALNYAGANVSESEIIERLHFDPTEKGRGVWGDPYEGFVGDIDGTMGKTGYGVYWEPIAEAGSSFRPSYAFTNMTPQDLTNHIVNNRPVVVWGYYGRGKRLTWKTPDGKTVKAVNGEHARTVVGFTGTVEDPTGFYLLDPIYGELYWSTDKLLKNWAPFENAGVVVY